MAGSLQDQLLKAGLSDKKKAKKINSQKQKAQKQSRKDKTELRNEAAELAEKAMQAEKEKSQVLNEQRKQEAEQKAIAAQVRQIVEMNKIFAFGKGKEDSAIAYNFSHAGKVKSLLVSSVNHDLISRGKIAIAVYGEGYALIPAIAASKINERNAEAIVLLNDSQASDQVDEDDPYADYQVPDDLMW
ncbi:MAG: DUF2058 domain-containing protein [uncultured Thiotrichaceae bacterium]|uniref:DUF2058 domain-containing protein n=1 Tax=uncultured Thiotrichaceae bacterium TaxID=298394 RepID=A0A6S6U3W1_9GAMM|nr:MAG: DUF2058 domain-containing protein [uncultured Thiotrichaceae bacterium]